MAMTYRGFASLTVHLTDSPILIPNFVRLHAPHHTLQILECECALLFAIQPDCMQTLIPAELALRTVVNLEEIIHGQTIQPGLV